LHENLEEQGRQLQEMPHILQYNKRDLPDLISIEELEQRLNPHAAPSFASVATVGEGVYEALEAISRAVLEDFENRMPEHRDMMTGQLTVPEGGLADALRDANLDEAIMRPKQVLRLDFSAEMPPPVQPEALESASFGEQAARLVTEPGTRPGVGTREAASEAWKPIPDTELEKLEKPQAAGHPAAASWNDTPSFTLARLWPHADREIVRAVEKSVARQDWVSAVTDCGTLVERTWAAVAQLSADPGLVQSPTLCCLILGVDGRKYLEFQRVLTSVRESCIPSEHEALSVFAFALGVRQSCATITSE